MFSAVVRIIFIFR